MGILKDFHLFIPANFKPSQVLNITQITSNSTPHLIILTVFIIHLVDARGAMECEALLSPLVLSLQVCIPAIFPDFSSQCFFLSL